MAVEIVDYSGKLEEQRQRVGDRGFGALRKKVLSRFNDPGSVSEKDIYEGIRFILDPDFISETAIGGESPKAEYVGQTETRVPSYDLVDDSGLLVSQVGVNHPGVSASRWLQQMKESVVNEELRDSVVSTLKERYETELVRAQVGNDRVHWRALMEQFNFTEGVVAELIGSRVGVGDIMRKGYVYLNEQSEGELPPFETPQGMSIMIESVLTPMLKIILSTPRIASEGADERVERAMIEYKRSVAATEAASIADIEREKIKQEGVTTQTRMGVEVSVAQAQIETAKKRVEGQRREAQVARVRSLSRTAPVAGVVEGLPYIGWGFIRGIFDGGTEWIKERPGVAGGAILAAGYLSFSALNVVPNNPIVPACLLGGGMMVEAIRQWYVDKRK